MNTHIVSILDTLWAGYVMWLLVMALLIYYVSGRKVSEDLTAFAVRIFGRKPCKICWRFYHPVWDMGHRKVFYCNGRWMSGTKAVMFAAIVTILTWLWALHIIP